VLSSRLSSVTEPLSALMAQQGVAVLFAVGIYVIVSERSLSTHHVATHGWVLAVASGIVQYACAFWLYLWALKGLSASVTGLFLNLIPVFGLLIAMPVLGDQLTAVGIIGSVVVLTWVKEEHHGIVVPAAPDASVSAP
jgi:drug/metabolite transporter (DMT)-like permease